MGGRHEVTQLLGDLREGDREALAKLLPIVYGERRRLAAHYMRQERPDHTLQPTALVHEAYLRLVGQRGRNWQNRAHFFAVAAQLMRTILVDHARANLAQKRGGRHVHLQLEDAPTVATPRPETFLALDEALARLGAMDERAARVVELRWFVGLSNEEVAAVMGISEITVRREWSFAKAWLQTELEGSGR